MPDAQCARWSRESFESSGLRTHLCGCLNTENLDADVLICGWVRSRRDHGGLIFVDLADYSGRVQVVFTPEQKESFALADNLRAEFVVSVRGQVRSRPEGTQNPDIPTGEIELLALEAELLSASEVPPFVIEDEVDAKEELRLKYRYLDLRRDSMQEVIRLRHSIYRSTRDYLDSLGFCEVETPILTKPTPEGARDFLVPSRLSQGLFYALPQSPQLFKTSFDVLQFGSLLSNS